MALGGAAAAGTARACTRVADAPPTHCPWGAAALLRLLLARHAYCAA